MRTAEPRPWNYEDVDAYREAMDLYGEYQQEREDALVQERIERQR